MFRRTFIAGAAGLFGCAGRGKAEEHGSKPYSEMAPYAPEFDTEEALLKAGYVFEAVFELDWAGMDRGAPGCIPADFYGREFTHYKLYNKFDPVRTVTLSTGQVIPRRVDGQLVFFNA